jgi:hypothetical protein
MTLTPTSILQWGFISLSVVYLLFFCWLVRRPPRPEEVPRLFSWMVTERGTLTPEVSLVMLGLSLGFVVFAWMNVSKPSRMERIEELLIEIRDELKAR